jgi:hypothetical protein
MSELWPKAINPGGLGVGPRHPSKDLPKICVRFSRSLNRPTSESRLTSTLRILGSFDVSGIPWKSPGQNDPA